jgi:hypothetical protein
MTGTDFRMTKECSDSVIRQKPYRECSDRVTKLKPYSYYLNNDANMTILFVALAHNRVWWVWTCETDPLAMKTGVSFVSL